MVDQQSEPLPQSFEEALAELDDIVASLEEDGVPLSRLIDQYDRGMRLLQSCETQLKEAKQRVTTITRSHRDADLSNPDEDAPDDELF